MIALLLAAATLQSAVDAERAFASNGARRVFVALWDGRKLAAVIDDRVAGDEP